MSLRCLTTEELTEMKVALTDAYKKALTAQSYSIGGRSLTRASAESLLKQLEKVCAELANRLVTDAGLILVNFGEPGRGRRGDGR